MNITLVLLAASLLLGIALAIAIKVATARAKKNAELIEQADALMGQIVRLKMYQDRKEEAQQNADAKKASIRTGDDTADFNNSLNVLHDASKPSRGS